MLDVKGKFELKLAIHTPREGYLRKVEQANAQGASSHTHWIDGVVRFKEKAIGNSA